LVHPGKDLDSWQLFVDPDEMTQGQLLWALLTYAYVLFTAANMIGDSSELLLLVPSMAPMVGSVVLPVLGAVPDGMMVLFSGLGPDAQSQVSVGVGALAGSTVMLLTATWFFGMLGGRVDIVDGACQYKPAAGKSKLTDGSMSWTKTGVEVQGLIAANAKIMIATSLLYLIIQVPATIAESRGLSEKEQAAFENQWSLVGAVACFLAFVAYLREQMTDDEGGGHLTNQRITDKIIAAVNTKEISLVSALGKFWAQEKGGKSPKGGSRDGKLGTSLLDKLDKEQTERLKKILKACFSRYDVNNDSTIDYIEFTALLKDLKVFVSTEMTSDQFKKADLDESGYINFEEFVQCVANCACFWEQNRLDKNAASTAPSFEDNVDDAEESEEEGEDVPEDLADLTVEEQQAAIKSRAFRGMFIGTMFVLVFSDPMVDVLAEVGVRTDIPAFYVSFVLAPLASNASELVAAYNYASKRTKNAMTISLCTLEGAACMNNTFCLCIFYALIYCKSLAWEFTAETACIVIVQWIMGYIALSYTVMPFGLGFLICALYPLSLALVWTLENIYGFD